MESGTESSGLRITTGRVEEIRNEVFSNGIAGLQRFEQDTELNMERQQPDLWRHLGGFATLTFHPESFSLGAYIAFAIIQEKQGNIKLTEDELKGMNKALSELHSSEKDPDSKQGKISIDFRGLEEKLQKDAPEFFRLIKAMQEVSEQKKPGAGIALYYGAMLTVFPFFRRVQTQEFNLLLQREAPEPTYPSKPK